MPKSGLRLPVIAIRRKLDKLERAVTAEEFRPELIEFSGKVLATCLDNTPVRDEQLIESNQEREYDHRINYIPSIHDSQADPRMIVRGNGVFVFSGGKWYRPDIHHVPAQVFADYTDLMAERERRLETSRRQFINDRKQARFLFQRSWWQVAQSLQLSLKAAQNVIDSVTRRKPKQPPPRGYAQIRGGKDVLTVVVFNSFLSETGSGASPYSSEKCKPFDGRQILDAAIAQHKPEFMRRVNNKVRRIIYSITKGRV